MSFSHFSFFAHLTHYSVTFFLHRVIISAPIVLSSSEGSSGREGKWYADDDSPSSSIRLSALIDNNSTTSINISNKEPSNLIGEEAWANEYEAEGVKHSDAIEGRFRLRMLPKETD